MIFPPQQITAFGDELEKIAISDEMISRAAYRAGRKGKKGTKRRILRARALRAGNRRSSERRAINKFNDDLMNREVAKELELKRPLPEGMRSNSPWDMSWKKKLRHPTRGGVPPSPKLKAQEDLIMSSFKRGQGGKRTGLRLKNLGVGDIAAKGVRRLGKVLGK